MQSHRYDFALEQMLGIVGTPLLGLGALALGLHLAARWGGLPSPRPALDLDRTILVHQVEAARSLSTAEVVLLGDSSCLMNVLADDLSARLGRPALNLGTLSYLDLAAYASLLREQARANPNLRTVILLLHPEALRRVGSEPYHAKLFDSLVASRDFCSEAGWYDKVSCWLGVEMLRARVLARVVPTPLPESYGRLYGFTADLEQFMDEHRGSLIEPARKPFTGNAEYRLAATLEALSRAFKPAIPAGVTFWAGITPVPAGFSTTNYPAQQREMLAEWSQWLGAEPLDLPATLPDSYFGRVTHLTAAGAEEYTRLLAQRLIARQKAVASRTSAQ